MYAYLERSIDDGLIGIHGNLVYVVWFLIYYGIRYHIRKRNHTRKQGFTDPT
jgi:hypothetical protein